nr:aspartic proteinase Asp1-like [Tanacetum cinerariifolium]
EFNKQNSSLLIKIILIDSLNFRTLFNMFSKTNFIFFLLALYAAFRFQGCHSDANRLTFARKTPSASSIVFQVQGNVYPTGYFYVMVNIGNPPKPYFLDIDTGSHLTWVQCDAPCKKCRPAPNPLYKPTSKVLVPCSDPLCAAANSPNEPHCESPNDQCDYNIQYYDAAYSLGILVKDTIPLQYMNGTVTTPTLAFGCGYDQEVPTGMTPPFVDGILGLGLGEIGILNQLQKLGVTKKVTGHCLSSSGNGYLFFGDGLVASDIIWTPMSTTEIEEHYSLGTAELYVGGTTTGMKDLPIVFDSGSTYTYLSPKPYEALISMLTNEGFPLFNANDDDSLPVCWKGLKPFVLVQDAKPFFKPIVLSFARSNDVRFQLDPKAYLIISKHANVCLGILNGKEAGLGDMNVIGDISFHDKIIVYDNEEQRIGFAPASCNKLPDF